MFFKNNSGNVDYIIVGLGNPGKKYENTRHNIGFEAVDYIAKELNISITKVKFDGLYGVGNIDDKKVLLLKPQTFMNLSGHSVKKAADFYKVPTDKIIVLFDDISLDVGKLRIRKEGSAGGHNGLKDIIALSGANFPRVKIGVGKKPHPEYDLANWVLSKFTDSEKKSITARFDDILSATKLIIDNDFTGAMSKYNG